MLNWIITASLRHRGLVILLTVAVVAIGAYAVQNIDIDAFPDTTPVQVQINTTAPALGPEEIERQITFPIEQVLGGLPRLKTMRSISKFGLSQVVLTFDDGTDIYFARQVATERLNSVELPFGVERSSLGPVATGMGEVFHYVVTGCGNDQTDMRTIHDWMVKPTMRTVRGTAEVNSWGGYEKQFQVRPYPLRLAAFGLTFADVEAALQANNSNVGGGAIRNGGQSLLVQGLGRPQSLEEIRQIVIRTHDGVPVKIGDVADVEIGHEIRRGAVTADGKGEVVLGLGFMLMGENSHSVTWAMKDKLEQIKPTLPPGTEIETVYDRTELVDVVIETVRKNLFEGGLFVVAVLFVFLGHLRAALIVAAAIPLSMMFAFMGMWRFAISASLLSLGAIDFGMVVDSSVVMVENCVRHLAHRSGRHRSIIDVVRDAAIEVRKPTMFGELIIMIVYLPILTLEGVEGKLFRPMALTVIFALAGSMLMSMTLMPVLASLFLSRRIKETEPWLMRGAKWANAHVLRFAMQHKLAVIGFALASLVVAFGLIAPNLGSEFVPRLSEGALAINVVRLAGTDLEESIRVNTQIERAVLDKFPDEVRHVWSRIGTAEIATDPMGVEITDVFISLKPREHWTRATTQAELTLQIEGLIREFPGQRPAFSQPIEMRLNEMVSGVRADLGIKLFGDDFTVLVTKAAEVERVLRGIQGIADLSVEQITGQPVLQIVVDQAALARHGISARTVLDLIESIGTKPVGEIIEGQLRFPLIIRLPDVYRQDPNAIGQITVVTDSGQRLSLSRLAKVNMVEGPSTITREWGQRRITITCNVRGRDLGSFVAEAQRAISANVKLPAGRYRIEYGGQFEHLQHAQLRLLIVVPLALVLIFGLLYLTYHNLADALRVLSIVPFACVGGLVALWLRDMPFSISAAVGFIAMSGVAVLDALILVSYIRQLREQGVEINEAVTQAAQTRLRPVLMTTLVASLGFLPMAFSTGVGAEVQRPLATVVIGGVIGAMVMSLVVLRVLFVLFTSPVVVNHRPVSNP